MGLNEVVLQYRLASRALVNGFDKLARVLGLMGTACAEDYGDIVACMNGDGDGTISLDEFKLMADLLARAYYHVYLGSIDRSNYIL